MFAVIKTGGKQYRVAADDILQIEKLDAEAGSLVEFTEILMVGEGANATIGEPSVEGALVTAEVMDQGRARKVIAFKKRRRQNSKRKRGHRQHYTQVQILEVLSGGAKPSKKASGKATPKNRNNGGLSLEAKGGNPAGKNAEAAIDTSVEAPAKAEKAPAKKTAAKKADDAKAEKPATKPAAKKADDGEKAPAKKPAAKKTAAKKEAKTDDGAKRAPLFTAPAGEPDDLSKIKGVGKVAVKELAEEGITTFAQIANLTDAEIEKIDAEMPFSAAQITDWKAQAAELAKS